MKVFFAGAPLQAGKTVSAVMLPNVGSAVRVRHLSMHVFALGLS